MVATGSDPITNGMSRVTISEANTKIRITNSRLIPNMKIIFLRGSFLMIAKLTAGQILTVLLFKNADGIT
jgi:hypothetical protein